jgi:hypothetical protein
MTRRVLGVIGAAVTFAAIVYAVAFVMGAPA